MGGQPLAYDQSCHRGQVSRDRRVDLQPCTSRATIWPPSGRGLRRKKPRRTRKPLTGRYYQLILGYAAIGTYLRDKINGADTGGYWWCSSGEPPPLRQVPGVGLPDQEAVEGHTEGVRVEAPKGPLGQVVVGWEDNGGGLGFLAGYQGRVHGDDRTPEGGGGAARQRERRAGRARPRLHFCFPSCPPSVYFVSFLCLVPFFRAAGEAG